MAESTSMEIQPVIASINNEDQNTQKEADIPGGNGKEYDKFVIEITKMVEMREIEPSKQCRIYKAPHQLRKWNEEAYTPQVISIGPFHHNNERLKAMEGYKERYFRSFVNRSKINLACLIRRIREMEVSIRGCYEETISLDSNRFVAMILMDASFIIELFTRDILESWTSDDLIFAEPRANAVMFDLLLLENQLPFFVIENIHDLAFPPPSDYNGLLGLSFGYFRYFNIQSINSIQFGPNVKIEHFTDLIRTFHLPPLQKQPQRHRKLVELLYSATQLHEAGVEFQVGASNRYLGIEFERGVLKISSIEINDMTEGVIRNIIALEQTRYIEYAYYTDYFLLLDSLINTRKDVDLLCDKKILIDYPKSRYATESIINNLKKGMLRVGMRDDYFGICTELNWFYEQRRHRWTALLKREFFSTPSAAVSTIITIVVITVLTLIQTVCSVMQVTDSSRKAV